MNVKYFLIIGLVVGMMALAPLSAADEDYGILDALDITPFDEETNVTIDGIDFNVPKGYGEQKDITKDNDSYDLGFGEVRLSNYQYMNEDGDLLNIQVMSVKDKNFTNDLLTPEDGEVKKTINGKEGFYSENDGVAMFRYAQDGKSILVAGESDVVSNVII